MASAAKGAPGTLAKPTPPNQTLYVRNLNPDLRKEDIKRNLYMLFAAYGVVLDVIAMKTPKMRGQAHVVMRDPDSSTQAMRALQGFDFFGKPMDIQYAKAKSDTVKKLDGTFQLPEKEAPESAEKEEGDVGFAPVAKAKPINAPDEKPAVPAEEASKGVKREREESESEDEEAAMDVSDSE